MDGQEGKAMFRGFLPPLNFFARGERSYGATGDTECSNARRFMSERIEFIASAGLTNGYLAFA